jgi:hypothetical protein
MQASADTNAKRKFIELALEVKKITDALMATINPKE